MIKAFIDSSVFVAAVRSPTGGSAEVLRFAVREVFEAVISSEVIKETDRHFEEALPGALPLFYHLLDTVPFSVVSPTTQDIEKAEAYTPTKDKAIVAGAEKGKVDYLITLDQKHLLNNQALKQTVPFKIVSPGEFLELLRTAGTPDER